MSKFKNFKKYLLGEGEGESNLNQFMKKKQSIVGVIVLVFLILFIFGLHSLSKHKKSALPKAEEIATAVDGVLSTDFTQKNELSALEQQQIQMDGLKKLFGVLKNQQDDQRMRLKDQRALIAKQVSAIIDDREKETWALKKTTQEPLTNHLNPNALASDAGIPLETTSSHLLRPLETIHFHYDVGAPKSIPYYRSSSAQSEYHTDSRYKKTPKNYVPAGTFARTVLLEGADANASVNAQSDTSGILVRVLDNGTLPNGHHSHLRGCFILASIYGDISSERGEARLTKISCTRFDGSIFEKKVEGYLSFAGKEGVKGTPVMRNGKVLMMAGLSGMLSGVGSALQQASQTQSISPLGVTNTIDANRVWQTGAYGGANSAMSLMAGYYIKRADQYHPIIEIGSGTIATVIFQSGFSLLDEEDNSFLAISNQKKHSSDNAEEMSRLINQAQNLSNSSPGQESEGESPFSNVN